MRECPPIALPELQAPCATTPVKFTWWGGILGPRLLSHVKCQNCGTAYNGKSGASNTTGIVIFMVVLGVVAVVLAIVLMVGAFVLSR